MTAFCRASLLSSLVGKYRCTSCRGFGTSEIVAGEQKNDTKPRRVLSPFSHFLKECSATWQAEGIGNQDRIGRGPVGRSSFMDYAQNAWKNMDDVERRKYVLLTEEEKEKKIKERTELAKKSKRPATPYELYLQEMLPELKTKNVGLKSLTSAQLDDVASDAWKMLSPAEKEVYRAKYERLKTSGVPEPKLPGRPNVIFSREKFPELKAKHPGMNAMELNKLASAAWKNLPPAKKEVYKSKFESAKRRYLYEMEEYKANRKLSE